MACKKDQTKERDVTKQSVPWLAADKKLVTCPVYNDKTQQWPRAVKLRKEREELLLAAEDQGQMHRKPDLRRHQWTAEAASAKELEKQWTVWLIVVRRSFRLPQATARQKSHDG